MRLQRSQTGAARDRDMHPTKGRPGKVLVAACGPAAPSSRVALPGLMVEFLPSCSPAEVVAELAGALSRDTPFDVVVLDASSRASALRAVRAIRTVDSL